ncbi:MAG: carbohydrate ABC transporter permease [Chloroflexota bacterium]
MRTTSVATRTTTPRLAVRERIDFFPYLLIAPTLILILGLTVVPAVYALIMSLSEVDYISITRFVGLANYANVLSDPETLTNVVVTLKFVGASIVGYVIIAFCLAIILNQKVVARSFFRTVVLIPWVTTQVVSTLVVKWMLDFDLGIVNSTLRGLGLDPVSFLSDPHNALLTLVGITVWRASPYGMVLLLAGLQTVPGELYEAAAVDGANALRRFLSITVPLIRGPMLIMLVMESMGMVSLVTPILVLTGGGPGNATDVLALRLFQEAFINFNMGTGATIAMLIFGLDIVLSVVYIGLLHQRGDG